MQTGRPPIWSDPEAFDKAVQKYFDENMNPKWSGLALHLGFESRKSLWEYGKKPEFSNSVKRALLRIEQYYEENLLTKNATGAIFALKNFDWKDKQEVDQRATIQDSRIDESKLTDDELRILAEIQRKSGISQA